jgi:4-hydroxy-2-oxoheptanedioate aldolase
MRPSRTLRRLRAGQIVRCTKLNLADPRVAEIAAAAGFDCLWLDLEHVPNTLRDLENQIRAAKAYDVDTLVRVSKGSYSDLVRPFEMDAAGIMVPHVMNLHEAKTIVHQTRFHPIGRRALDGGNADGGYTIVPTEVYVEQSNRERFVIVQIEDPEAMEELDAIAALPGLDMLFFGPGDFAHGLGRVGEYDHPAVLDARGRVAEAARAHGKYAGTVASAANVSELIALGYRFLSVGADVVALTSQFRAYAAAFGEAAGAPIRSLYQSTPAR